MAAQNEVLIRIQAELGDLKRELGEVKGLIGSTAASASKFEGLGRALTRFGLQAAASVGGLAAITGAIRSVITASAEFETLRVRLEQLYGSAEKGREVFNKLARVAATTPFELTDIVNAGVVLKSFGADAENLTKVITDLAARMGTTATEAAGAFGRAFAAGAGAADILREKGILELVKSFKGIEDLTKLTLPQFRQALIDTLQDPLAGVSGSTSRLSATFAGTMSNLKDSIVTLAAEVGQGLTPQLDTMAKALQGAAEGAKAFFEELNGRGIDETISKMRELGVQLGPLLRTELRKAKDELRALQDQLFTGKTKGVDDFIDVDKGKARIKSLETEMQSLLTSIDATWASIDKTIANAADEKTAEFFRRQGREIEESRLRIVAAREREIAQIQSQVDLLETIQGKEAQIYQIEGDIEELRQTGRVRAKAASDADRRVNDAKKEQKATEELVAANLELVAVQLEIGRLTGGQAEPYQAAKFISDFVEMAKARAAALEQERTAIEYLKRVYPDVAAKLGLVEDSFAGVAESAEAALEKLAEDATFWQSSLVTVFQGLGEAMSAAWTGDLSGMRAALKAALNTILEAIHAEVLGAEVSAVAKAFTAGGFNPFAGFAALVSSMPTLLGIEAMFAGFRAAVTKFEHGGVIDRPTYALMGEAVQRSGREIVAPERGFKRELRGWLDEVALPMLTGGGGADNGLLLAEVQGLRADLNPSRFGRAAGRSIGRELAVNARGLL